jgi:Bacterial PH domain
MVDDPRAGRYRSRFNQMLSGVIWAACGAGAGLLIFVPGGFASPATLAPLLAIVAGTWVTLWRPHIAVDDDGVRIANVTHWVFIPWPAVIHVDTKYSLTVHVPGRHFSAVAAPAPGRMSTAGRSSAPAGSRKAGADVRPGDLQTTDSGRAAAMIRNRWEELRNAGRIEPGVAGSTPVTLRPDVVAIVVLLCSAATVLLALTVW